MSSTQNAPLATATSTQVAARTPRDLSIYSLYRRLRNVLVSLEHSTNVEHLASRLLDALVETGGEAALTGGRAYRRLDDRFELFAMRGESGVVGLGHVVPASYPPLAAAMRHGWALFEADDPALDPAVEAPFGGRAFAVLALASDADHLLAFTVREPLSREALSDVLATLRSVADLALRQRDLQQLLAEAREVQTSLLPVKAPAFPGFDIAFSTQPATLVGGDLYDFRVAHPGTLAFAIGDATGHGLPAALQARDAVIGLRMSWANHRKLAKSFEELAGVLREGSGGGRRFISVLAGEVDLEGNLVYVNAGHPAGLIVRDGAVVRELTGTGPVMGVVGVPHYRLAFAWLEPGDLLVLYTDGITEARSPDGEELGVERMVARLGRQRDESAASLVDGVRTLVAEFTGGMMPADDQTVVIVRRER